MPFILCPKMEVLSHCGAVQRTPLHQDCESIIREYRVHRAVRVPQGRQGLLFLHRKHDTLAARLCPLFRRMSSCHHPGCPTSSRYWGCRRPPPPQQTQGHHRALGSPASPHRRHRSFIQLGTPEFSHLFVNRFN
ncbi:hypothetical protein DUNSADRAFT_8966 [Dunaliella salina]|uniref:Encoded protein n=1 Tax=Dunaliella salina TaxID=3046 RepID=A0ABQ7GID2_DUNSA|nr:hypothetical protein DUNSADRAFT_8966 [Dunaliella salina]|eukprot:KAF5834380.1 hypothetical protein DUNSADRAFT_8966 [Dunaliella salina]